MASHYPFYIIHGAARVIILLSAIVTLSYSGKGHESVMISGFELEASYKGAPAFMLLRIMSWIVIASTVGASFYLYIVRPKSLTEDISPDKAQTCLILLFIDIVMMSGVITAWASAGATYHTCYYGNMHLAWIPICEIVKNYCNKRFITIISTCFTIFGFMVASAYSAYMLKTFSAPSSSSNDEE